MVKKAGGSFQIIFANCSTAGDEFVRIRNTGSVDIEGGTEVLAKLRRGGETLSQDTNSNIGTLSSNDLSNLLAFDLITTYSANKEHTLTLSVGTIERSITVNCT